MDELTELAAELGWYYCLPAEVAPVRREAAFLVIAPTWSPKDHRLLRGLASLLVHGSELVLLVDIDKVALPGGMGELLGSDFPVLQTPLLAALTGGLVHKTWQGPAELEGIAAL